MYKVHPITALICYYLASAIGMNPRPMSKGWTPLHWIIMIWWREKLASLDARGKRLSFLD